MVKSHIENINKWAKEKSLKPSDTNGFKDFLFGTPEGIRTPDLLVRSQTLYPTELPAHAKHISIYVFLTLK